MRSVIRASKLKFVAVSALALALGMGATAKASAERPKEPAKIEVIKPQAVPAPKPQKPAVKKPVAKKAVKKKAVVKKAKPKVAKHAVATKPLRSGPEVKYDIEHMPVPSSIAAPVQAGGTAEALANPSPVLSAPSAIDAPVAASDLPPEIMATARPGQCFAQLITAPATETVTEQVVTREAHKAKKIYPARYEWVEESYVVSSGAKVTRHIPPTYRAVRETVVESPATVREIEVSARYETRTERVLRSPERQVWVLSETLQGAHRPNGKLDWPGKVRTDGDGRVWCLMTLPAEYEEVTRTVEVAPATIKRIEVPAVTKVIERRIIDVPAHDEVIEGHPVYGIRKIQKMIELPREEWIDVPAAYATRKVTRQVGPSKTVWAEVLCLKTASKAKIIRMQSALKAKGYYKGRIDGFAQGGTLKAMNDFQTAKGLPSGQISVAGFKALGVF